MLWLISEMTNDLSYILIGNILSTIVPIPHKGHYHIASSSPSHNYGTSYWVEYSPILNSPSHINNVVVLPCCNVSVKQFLRPSRKKEQQSRFLLSSQRFSLIKSAHTTPKKTLVFPITISSTMRSVCVIVGKGPFGRGKPRLSKQESCGSLKSAATVKTEVSGSLDGSSHHLSLLSETPVRPSVCFDLNDQGDIREEVYEYPAVEQEYKEACYWSQEEVANRSAERTRMVEDDCPERAHFIACVEELFNVPIRKRLSSRKDEESSEECAAVVTEEEAIQGLSKNEYRGYEHRCVRSIVSLRRRALRQIVTAHWVRGGHQCHEVAAKLSQRQARFARLVAAGDAQLAAQYHGESS